MSELNHMTAPALLQVENLRVSFKNEEKQYIETVKGISFSIPVNTTVALVGESGSGKSVTSWGYYLQKVVKLLRTVKFCLRGKTYSIYHAMKCGKSAAKILP